MLLLPIVTPAGTCATAPALALEPLAAPVAFLCATLVLVMLLVATVVSLTLPFSVLPLRVLRLIRRCTLLLRDYKTAASYGAFEQRLPDALAAEVLAFVRAAGPDRGPWRRWSRRGGSSETALLAALHVTWAVVSGSTRKECQLDRDWPLARTGR